MSTGFTESHPPEPVGAPRAEFLATLGVLWPCTAEDVKQAYLVRAKRLHPDVGGDPAAFLALQEAYEQALHYAEFCEGRTRWLAGAVERYLEREKFVSALRERGAKVKLEGVPWLGREIGDDFAQLLDSLTSIAWTGPAIDDRAIAWLTADPRQTAALHALDLSDSQITDAGVALLGAIPSLRRLDIHRTAVTARGFEVLDDLPRLAVLGISGTPLGWLALRRLRHRHPELTILRA